MFAIIIDLSCNEYLGSMETVAWRCLSCSLHLFDFGLAKIMTWLHFEVMMVLLVSLGGEDFLVGNRF